MHAATTTELTVDLNTFAPGKVMCVEVTALNDAGGAIPSAVVEKISGVNGSLLRAIQARCFPCVGLLLCCGKAKITAAYGCFHLPTLPSPIRRAGIQSGLRWPRRISVFNTFADMLEMKAQQLEIGLWPIRRCAKPHCNLSAFVLAWRPLEPFRQKN